MRVTRSECGENSHIGISPEDSSETTRRQKGIVIPSPEEPQSRRSPQDRDRARRARVAAVVES